MAAKTKAPRRGDYDRYRQRQADISRERSQVGRDIGKLPKVEDPKRKRACRLDLERFGLTYFPDRFPLPLAAFHREGLAVLQRATHVGGRSVIAWPRGSGKDSWIEVEILRALLYRLRRFVGLVGATEAHARRSLKKIKRELERNDRLAADFPEVCYPIRCLDRNPVRARMQTYRGAPTLIEWTEDSVILPTIAGKRSSGSGLFVAGITGAIRGPSILGPDGEPIRPDLVIVNDAQTRESAASPTQTAQREAIVLDDVLMLAGPDVEIAATMLCTVIYRGDLSDRFLDPERHPGWRSVRSRMLEAFPSDMALWDQYAELRRAGLREGDGGRAGTEFYKANRAAMDAGGRVSWPARKRATELSGLQSAMNLFIDNRRGFFAEAQNEPEDLDQLRSVKRLSADAVAARVNGAERATIPPNHTRLTAFVDLGQLCHWWAVVAWSERFGGAVIDYGTWPAQNRTVFAADDARPSLVSMFAGHPSITTEDQRIYAGLEGVAAEVLDRPYALVGGGMQPIDVALIDSGKWTATVYQWIQRRAGRPGVPVHPSKGFGRTTTSRGVSEWKPRPGERKGYHWRLTSGDYGRTRAVQFDPDAWKTVVHSSLTAAAGGALGLWLYGTSAARHELIGHHCAAEVGAPVTIRGTTFDKWELPPSRPDNHLWDCLVGCAVAASVLGLEWSPTADGTPDPPNRPRARTLGEMQADARRRAAEDRGRRAGRR
jgi:hypothetical protein